MFSPETFVQIKEGQIASFPMKGTIDATIPNATEIILADKKEKAEHCTIVDRSVSLYRSFTNCTKIFTTSKF